MESQGTNEDDSQSDPHPEAGKFRGQTTQNFGPKDCRDTVDPTRTFDESYPTLRANAQDSYLEFNILFYK